MKPFLIVSILVLFAVNSNSQKVKFSSINQLGLLNGSKGESWTVQTINGFKKDKWFGGVGAGLDLYNERTIPVFFDVRRDITSKKNAPFVYADGGVNFLWLNFVEKEAKQFPSSSPGLFYD